MVWFFLDLVPIAIGMVFLGLVPEESGWFFVWILAVRVSIIQQYKHNNSQALVQEHYFSINFIHEIHQDS